MPGPERRTWFFLGLASYEGVLRGAGRPGAIATFVQDGEGDPLVDRGVPPAVVRQFVAHQAVLQGGAPLPSRRGKPALPTRPDGAVDRDALPAAMLPAWARSQKLGKRGEPRPIAGGSDAPEAQRFQGAGRGPHVANPRGTRAG